MNILHAVLSEAFYGSERYCIDLATAQARAGHRVAVLIEGPHASCAQVFRREIDAATAAIAEAPPDASGGGIRLVAIPRAAPSFLHRPLALAILARWRPQIVHTHLDRAAQRVGSVAQTLGIAHVATLHIRYEPRAHAACDGLICGAAWQRADIPPAFGGEIAVVWPWLPKAVQSALFDVTPEETSALRDQWAADERTIVFGSVGRLISEKGMDVLIRAFRTAFAQGGEPVRLVIVGGGSQIDELETLADGDGRIILMGAQADVAPFYCAFDVYVSASRFEPFGLTILEAMDAGCTLVVTRTEGPREFLQDANVLWAEPDDVAALAAELRSAAARGRRRLSYDLAPFSQPRAVAAIEDFYRAVLRRREPRG